LKPVILSFLLFACLQGTTRADVYRPAYLEIQQTTEYKFDVLWKVPARGTDRRLALYVMLPEDVEMISPVRTTFVGTAFIETYSITRQAGLSGARISIDGLTRVATEVLVRIEWLDGSTEVARLTPAVPSFLVTGAPQFWEVARTYTLFGMQHIWQGNDHLLFVACLVLIAGTWRRILITITGFTIAHSITLTLAALELVYIPVPPVEAVIALSIVFLAREIALDRRDTLTWRYPIAVSASFGLLHGFGFASALADIGLPQTEIPAALLSFNIGVEIGQIVFVAVIIGLFRVVNLVVQRYVMQQDSWLRFVEKPAAYSVGGITMYWLIERVSDFWI
jgi:hydrogenase/urease accessory protein HupE